MEYIIEEIKEFTLIGLIKEIPFNKGYELCPKFWNEFNEKYYSKIDNGSEESKTIIENNIGEYAVCIDENKDTFKYMIAGKYLGGSIPNGFELFKFNKSTWIKFKCIGTLPNALQELNTKIWEEFIPNFKEYKLSGNANIEWYSDGDVSSSDYESGIWLPIEKK